MPKKEQVEGKRRRHRKVATLLCECMTPQRIVWAISEEFGVTEPTVWKDIKHVRENVLPTWYAWGDQRAMAIEACARLERIADKAYRKGDLGNAIKAIRQMCELQGLNSAQQIAGKKDTLRGELDALRDRMQRERQSGPEKSPAEFSLEAFNEIRAMYGQRTLTADEYAAYKTGCGPAGQSN